MSQIHANFRSARLPGGDLVSAVLDRSVMGLADRGGASNLIGARWADTAAAWTSTWAGTTRRDPAHPDRRFVIERVIRLDDDPRVATQASRQGQQNPDFLISGACAGQPAIQAADAKFSIETARSKQVSPEMVAGLLTLGPVVTDLIGHLPDGLLVLPGVFLTPDYLLTDLMMQQRQGILRATVSWSEVALVPVDPEAFFGEMAGAPAMRLLADHDRLPVSVTDNLLAGLYYMRLARAAVGCWLDATKPLLLHHDTPGVDDVMLLTELSQRRAAAPTAYQLVRTWHEDVEAIRAQRAAVDQVANLPLPNRELRSEIERIAAANDVMPPSVNQVRRRLGAWYRAALRAEVGPVSPPVTDLAPVLERITVAGAALAPHLAPELVRIVLAIGHARRADDDAVAEPTFSGTGES